MKNFNFFKTISITYIKQHNTMHLKCNKNQKLFQNLTTIYAKTFVGNPEKHSHSSNGNGLLTPIIVAFSFKSSSTGLLVYPITSTLYPSRINDCAWYCILGLRPISPNTTTQTFLFFGAPITTHSSRSSAMSVEFEFVPRYCNDLVEERTTR